MSSSNSTEEHGESSLSERLENTPRNCVNREQDNHISSSRHDSAPKRLTVDIGELRRLSDGQSKENRAKHISVSGGTVREIKFLRSPTSRVSTLFSTKIPEIRGSEKQKSSKTKATIEPGFVFFGDGLFDFTEERNEEAVAFSTEIGNLRAKLCGKVELNLGYLLSPTVTQDSNSLPETLEEVRLSLEIFIEDQESPVLMNCSSKTCVSEVLAKVLERVWKQTVNPDSIINSAYTLKVCGYQEYLSSLKLLCEYEYVHRCVMARQTVRLVLLDSDQVPRSLARSELDDVADCEPRIYSQFFERSLDTSVSRDGLSVLREAFEEELKRVLKDADSLRPCFQPGRLVQSVRAVCTTLGQIETKGIVNSVHSLKEMKRKYDEACQAASPSPKNVPVDMPELRSLLQELYRHVYLLIELYCNTFNTDFGRICISEKVIHGSIEVTAMTDKFSIFIPTAYRIPPDWKEKFESYVVEGKIYYGTNLLSVPEYTISGGIRTNFFAQISWQCFMEFGIELRKLPRESKLCLTLYGVAPLPKNATLAPTRTPLGWTAVQLFDFNGVLVSGSQLFGLWPNQAANPIGTSTSNLIDKRSAILQVDFTQHMSDIVFPSLKIPEREADASETPPEDLFKKFLSRDMFEDLRPEDIQKIWKNRLYASMIPSMLPLLLSSVPDWTYQNLPEIYQLLANWKPMSPVNAMELLKVQFPDQMVRATAVSWMECFSDDELCDYLPQLVQALKYESYHNSPLARFLIERALHSSRLMHYLFWYLKDNIGDPKFGQRYQVILGGLLSVCGSLQRDQFTKQDELVARITDVAEKVKKSKENLRDDVLRGELGKIPQETLECLRLPLNPGVEITAILADQCSYFNSNSSVPPLRLLFKNSDRHGFEIDTIYKVGDDLRQDALTMQLIGIMNKLWLKEGLDLKMVTYRCLPTGAEMGMVELVQEAQTLREIQTEYGLAGSFKDEPLARWLLKHNPIEKEYGEAVNNFISSCAGYCVATYVIGICDRHNDNIMVKKTGHLFHIDFSKFLGRSQMFGSFRRDRSPFVLTSDMAYVINGGCTPTSRFQDFVDLCCRAFNIIRHHTNLFLNLLSLMLNSGIPYLSQTNDLKYVYNVLLPQATDLEATTIFTRQIESSLASRFTQVNFFIHNVAQIRHASQMKDDDSAMPVLSFSLHTYSPATDDKITSARVVDYQKRYTPEKYYVYLINVCRENQERPTFVFRRYSHFHEFNAKLTDLFPHRNLPKLPGKIYLGRSQIRMVAEKRRQDFDRYLQALLSLEDVNSSKLVYTFLHSLPSDDFDVKKYAVRLLPEERYPRDRPIGGEVKVSISFSAYQLNIMIMHAKNLLPKSAGGLSDPYVKIYLTPDPNKSTKRKTKIARRTLNPTYNETFVWVISEEELRQREIRITVWDYDVLTENELMGGVLIDPSDYDFNNQFVGWFTLTDLKGS
ncbi:phosphatidylinositol 4-phosphate 3-kinase C2 domain-containing subunit beta-like [Dendronephthya gigantea]|uniref:phosphatidylinositol 4-phosphate 3-kinase C2 domain-containing subunit beta-like n=1 Tax=Dendronephthya gigantea TaxID=151771 RepID=UPI00106A9A00|nr:phosphatidylinositol 4-phosphate 3-kinase C2 domain-containing subunit beta-like [Dendronephthya gigantea]